MLRLHRNGDDLAPRLGGGSAPALQAAEHAVLREHLKAAPDASLAELQAVLLEKQAVSVSQAKVSRAWAALNLPRKKKFLGPRTR